MKSQTSFASLALLLVLPFGSMAAELQSSYISTMSYQTVSSTSSPRESTSASSLYYTDGAGRLTNFEMQTEDGVMTLTIRQDGAVVWSRAFKTDDTHFAVSRRESLGRVYFYITAGSRHFEAQPNEKGEWDVTPVGKEKRVVPL